MLEIVIKGDAKEIAALVLAVQERHESEAEVKIRSLPTLEALQEFLGRQSQ